MKLDIRDLPAFQVIGIQVRTVNAAERQSDTAKIPKLWKRFFEEQIEEQIPGRTDPHEIVGVYHNYENDFQGFYTLLIGQQSTFAGPLPGALVRTQVPAQQYLVFDPVPARPEEIQKVWRTVWDYFSQAGPFQRAYSHDFEVYRGKTMQLYLGVQSQ
jgi:predicted transcriptional regulator YdeE